MLQSHVFLPRLFARHTKPDICACLKPLHKGVRLLLGHRNHHLAYLGREHFISIPRSHVNAKYSYQVQLVTLHRELHTSGRTFKVDSELSNRTSFGQSSQDTALYHSPLDPNQANIVEVSLTLDQRFQDVEALASNIRNRGIDIDVYAMEKQYRDLQELKKQKCVLESKKEAINTEMKTIVKNKQNSHESKERKQQLITQGKELRTELKEATRLYLEAERCFMPLALKLPAELDPNNPIEDEDLAELVDKPELDFEVLSHMQLTEKSKWLTFSPVSPGAYYLRGELAYMDRDLAQLGRLCAHHMGALHIASPDLIRDVVMEGGGVNIHDPTKVFALEQRTTYSSDSDGDRTTGLDIPLYLSHSSVAGFLAYLTRMNIHEDSLPLKCFSTSTVYKPADVEGVKRFGLYSVPQTTSVELFGVSADATQNMKLFMEFIFHITEFYQNLKVPFKIVQVGSRSLSPSECQRLDFMVWSPAFKQYFKAGEVSERSDYSSRRLMTKYTNNLLDATSDNFVHMVHGTLMNVQPMLAALMELSQTQDGQFDISHVWDLEW